MAVFSAIFVTFAVILIVAFSPALLGDWISGAPPIVLMATPWVAIALGLLSGWQTVRQAKQKALRKALALAEKEAAKPQCPGCGERLDAGTKKCPVCGKVLA
jgi:hypothetical protein